MSDKTDDVILYTEGKMASYAPTNQGTWIIAVAIRSRYTSRFRIIFAEVAFFLYNYN